MAVFRTLFALLMLISSTLTKRILKLPKETDTRDQLRELQQTMLANSSTEVLKKHGSTFNTLLRGYADEVGVTKLTSIKVDRTLSEDARTNMRLLRTRTARINKIMKKSTIFFPQSRHAVLPNVPGKYYWSGGFSPCVGLVAFSETNVFVSHFDEKNRAYKMVTDDFPKLGSGKIFAFVGFGTGPDSPIITFEIISAIADLKRDDIDLYLFDSQANEDAPLSALGTQDLFFAPQWPGETASAHAARVNKIFEPGQGGSARQSTDPQRFLFAVEQSPLKLVPDERMEPNLVYDPPQWGDQPKDGNYKMMGGRVAKRVSGGWIWVDP